ncbi:hypothetical protein JNL27_16000 [bacterium]|nr:hypothetical protein [bacterium]
MNKDYSPFISKMDNQQLNVYLTDYLKYETDAVECAFKEFERRGLPLDLEQVKRIRSEMNLRETRKTEQLAASNFFAKNIVSDQSAPQLYSERALFMFSTLLAPLFGSVLIYLNLKSLGKREGSFFVVNFGFIYLAIVILLNEYSPIRLPVYLINAFGAIILQYWFWNKYIGRDFKYRTRPIWYPLVVGICLFGFFIFYTSFFVE